MRTALFILACCTLGRGALTVDAAPPQVTGLFPAGGAPGSTVSAEIVGKIDSWPPRVWVVTADHRVVRSPAAALRVTPLEKSGKLEIQLSTNAAPGLYWLRFAQTDGVSAWVPWVVENSPEQVEVEANDALEQATTSDLPVVWNGRLAKSGDVDAFRVTLAAGDLLVARVLANHVLASPIDCVLQICDPAGFVLAQNDDDRGLDPGLAWRVSKSGEYVVRLFGFPATPNSTIGFSGASNAVYRLLLSTGPVVDGWLPTAVGPTPQVVPIGWNLEPSAFEFPPAPAAELAWFGLPKSGGWAANWLNQRTKALDLLADQTDPQTHSLPLQAAGRLANDGDELVAQMDVEKDSSYRFRIQSQSWGYACDPLLRLETVAGKRLLEADDTRPSLDIDQVWKATVTGPVRCVVSDRFGNGSPRHLVRVQVAQTHPELAASIDKDAYVAKVSQAMELKVTLDRRHGFAEDVSVRVAGGPASLEVEPVVSRQADKDSAKQVTLKLIGRQTWQGPLRIVIADSAGNELTAATAKSAPTWSPAQWVWLTVRE